MTLLYLIITTKRFFIFLNCLKQKKTLLNNSSTSNEMIFYQRIADERSLPTFSQPVSAAELSASFSQSAADQTPMPNISSRNVSSETLSTPSFLNCFDDGETGCYAAAYSKALAQLRDYISGDTYVRESSQLQSCIDQVYSSWPYVPPLDIVHFDMQWSLGELRKVRINSHLHNDFGAAVMNINSAGRALLESEEDSLRSLLRHWCGWSATDPSHGKEPCFQYIQHRFQDLGPLYPILDNATWPEEVALLPPRLNPCLANYFLFASASSYYLYLREDDCMFHCGDTISDVHQGLETSREQLALNEGGWRYIEYNDWVENEIYFPEYEYHPVHKLVLCWEVMPFVAAESHPPRYYLG